MSDTHGVILRYLHLGAYVEPPNEYEVFLFESSEKAVTFVKELREKCEDGVIDEETQIIEIRHVSTLPGQGIFDQRPGIVNKKQYSWDDTLAACAAMKKFGGGFVKLIAEATLKADHINRRILQDAYPQYFEKYLAMAKDAPKEGV